MTIIQSVILGIVEGVTEFLPMSSTGHLILTNKLLGFSQSDFIKTFEITIQLGAILAVVALYWKKFTSGAEIWKKILIAFIPTAILGFSLYRIFKEILLANVALVIWALLAGGIALIFFELWYAKKPKEALEQMQEITYKQSFLIGIVQAFSIIPGISRSGATIIGGLAMGLSRAAIVEFSFLLALPTMAAATGYDLFKSAPHFSSGDFYLLAIGFVTSFLVALVSIKWLLEFTRNHTFIPFGIYRIAIALLMWVIIT